MFPEERLNTNKIHLRRLSREGTLLVKLSYINIIEISSRRTFGGCTGINMEQDHIFVYDYTFSCGQT